MMASFQKLAGDVDVVIHLSHLKPCFMESDQKKENKKLYCQPTHLLLQWSVVAYWSSAPDASSGVVRKPECGFDSR